MPFINRHGVDPMQNLEQLADTLRDYLPNLLAAVGILVVGALAAMFVAALVRLALKRTTLDNRLAGWLTGEEAEKLPDIERGISRVVFVVLMLFVLVAFFQALGLTLLTNPLNELLNDLLGFLPRLAGAAILALVAWLVATALRALVLAAMTRLNFDARVAGETPTATTIPVSRALSDVVYWLVWLLFFPAILGALALEGLLQPVQALVSEILAYVPNVLTVVVIVGLGWFVARTLQRIVTNLFAAVGTDRLSENVGLDRALGERRLSGVLGLVVYVLVLIPVIIAGLNALGIEAITAPASEMLGAVMGALPALFAATILLAIAYVVARVVAGLVSNLLNSIGFDSVLSRLGLRAVVAEGRRPSDLVGYVVMVAIMLFATIEAFGLLGFDNLAVMFSDLALFGGRVLVSLVVFGAGLYLAGLAGKALETASIKHNRLLGGVARGAILLLAGAMALRQLGVADSIITLAFGLTVGAIAVALAVAFGLGGRDMAARQLEEWHGALNRDDG
jgi:hypothetical protein